jgi:hypothetical protein
MGDVFRPEALIDPDYLPPNTTNFSDLTDPNLDYFNQLYLLDLFPEGYVHEVSPYVSLSHICSQLCFQRLLNLLTCLYVLAFFSVGLVACFYVGIMYPIKPISVDLG